MSSTPTPSLTELSARYEVARNWLLDYKASTGFTWAKIAREVGGNYAETTLNLFGSGKYPVANSAQLVAAIEAFARLVDARRTALRQHHFVLTSIAKTVNNLIWQTQLFRRIGIISGDSGIGKSEAMQHHAAGTPNAAHLTLNPHIKTSYGLLPKMLAAIGRPEGKLHAPHILYDRLLQHTRGTSWFFLIDDAHFLLSETLDMLRCYQEEAGGVPIVLSGNARLYQNAQWAAGQSVAAFTQFDSRCAVRVHLSASDIKRGDVIAIAQQLIGAQLTESCVEILLRQAKLAPSGSLRHLVTILQTAQTQRQDTSAPVTKQDIAEAIETRSRKGSSVAA